MATARIRSRGYLGAGGEENIHSSVCVSVCECALVLMEN